MGTRVVIDGRGVVESSGTTSMSVEGPLTVGGGISAAPVVTSGSATANALTSPGFYFLPGTATGTLPVASSQPGAKYIFTQPLGDLGPGGFLTGSSGCSLGTSAANAAIFFITGTFATPSSLAQRANGITLSKFSSVEVTSDSKYWCVHVLSGTVSASLFPNNG